MQIFDLKKYLRKNRPYIWVFIAVFLVAQIGSALFVITRDQVKKFVASSQFEVINGDKTYNLYQGTYHKITTFDDVASVVRSNEVIREVIEENDIDKDLARVRESIDIYEVGDMVFQLDLIWDDKDKAGPINTSIVKNYLKIIESRMDDDNSELFDVNITEQTDTYEMGSRLLVRILASFLFSIFCGIIIVLGIDLIKRISSRRRIDKGP